MPKKKASAPEAEIEFEPAADAPAQPDQAVLETAEMDYETTEDEAVVLEDAPSADPSQALAVAEPGAGPLTQAAPSDDIMAAMQTAAERAEQAVAAYRSLMTTPVKILSPAVVVGFGQGGPVGFRVSAQGGRRPLPLRGGRLGGPRLTVD